MYKSLPEPPGRDLSGQDLRGQDFSEHDLTATNFQGAQCQGCNFQESMIVDADMSNADFTGARFTGATLSNVDFTGSKLDGADFSRTSFSPVYAAPEQFDNCLGLENDSSHTIWQKRNDSPAPPNVAQSGWLKKLKRMWHREEDFGWSPHIKNPK